MTAEITMKLRPAVNTDFSDLAGNKKIGAMYFQFSKIRNEFDLQPYYFNQNTNIYDFKELYANGQIYVVARFLDQVEIKK